jgi:hypothetical protein
MYPLTTTMAVDLYVQHRDPDGQIPHQEFRSQGRNRVERFSERETIGRDEPARDAELSDPAFAHFEYGAVELSERERNYGVYVLGKTGSGKTVALTNLALLDIYAGKAVIFFDPHGHAARSIVDRIPRWRAEKVCYLDLSRMNTLAWNPLVGIPLHRAARAAINLTDALKDIWPDTWGERLASFLRNGFQLLIEHGHATLRDLPRIYYDKDHREKFTSKINDPLLNEFWNGEYRSYDDRQRREAQGPILNRIGQFLAIPEIRTVVSHRSSTLDLRTAIDNNYIVIVNLSKGTIGHTPSSIFGSLLASSIKTALMSREDTSEDERAATAFYADEFHNYGTIAWAEMLSECRKYGLQLTLAHQYAAQLHPQVLSAVLGNVDCIMVFRIGIDDAERLHGNFTRNNLPLNPAELAEQLPYHAFLKRGLEHYRIETAAPFPTQARYEQNARSSLRRFAPH